MWTLVRFVPAVDLPVPVEAAGVSQHLAALLTLHTFLPVIPDLPDLSVICPIIRI